MASVLARAALNASISAAFEANDPLGTSGSGAWNFWLRSGIVLRIISSLPLVLARTSGVAGAFIVPSAMPRSMSSDLVMCSAASATDQRSGADFHVHCASLTPSMDFRNAASVFFRWSTSLSRSALVTSAIRLDENTTAPARAARNVERFNMCPPT